MNRFRTIAMAIAMLFALPAFAGQNSASTTPDHALPSVDDHLHMLSEKLDLSAEQQEKARPILEQMQSAIGKVLEDKSLTRDEVAARVHPIYMKADKQMRVFLSDDQKKRLDNLEQESHLDVHRDSSGSVSPRN